MKPELKNLSKEIKDLVSSGVWSLYKVDNISGAAFLVRSKEGKVFLLSNDGDFVREDSSINCSSYQPIVLPFTDVESLVSSIVNG